MSTAGCYELSDFEWSVIQPLLPDKPRGMPRADDRTVLNGVHWRLRTGSPSSGHLGALQAVHDLRQPLPALGQDRGLGPHLRGGLGHP